LTGVHLFEGLVEEVVQFVATVVVAASFAWAGGNASSILVLESSVTTAASVGISSIATSVEVFVGSEDGANGAAFVGVEVDFVSFQDAAVLLGLALVVGADNVTLRGAAIFGGCALSEEIAEFTSAALFAASITTSLVSVLNASVNTGSGEWVVVEWI